MEYLRVVKFFKFINVGLLMIGSLGILGYYNVIIVDGFKVIFLCIFSLIGIIGGFIVPSLAIIYFVGIFGSSSFIFERLLKNRSEDVLGEFCGLKFERIWSDSDLRTYVLEELGRLGVSVSPLELPSSLEKKAKAIDFIQKKYREHQEILLQEKLLEKLKLEKELKINETINGSDNSWLSSFENLDLGVALRLLCFMCLLTCGSVAVYKILLLFNVSLYDMVMKPIGVVTEAVKEGNVDKANLADRVSKLQEDLEIIQNLLKLVNENIHAFSAKAALLSNQYSDQHNGMIHVFETNRDIIHVVEALITVIGETKGEEWATALRAVLYASVNSSSGAEIVEVS